jgi:hypothetical protein
MGEGTDFHAHHAIQVTLALTGGDVRFRRPGEDWTAHKAAIITANQSHAFEARGELVALILAEPESREGRAIQQRFGTGIASLPADTLEQESLALAAAFNTGGADAELVACARAVISRLSAAHPLPAKPFDNRIERAIALLRDRPGDAVTMAEIADAVHLSPERFQGHEGTRRWAVSDRGNEIQYVGLVGNQDESRRWVRDGRDHVQYDHRFPLHATGCGKQSHPTLIPADHEIQSKTGALRARCRIVGRRCAGRALQFQGY